MLVSRKHRDYRLPRVDGEFQVKLNSEVPQRPRVTSPTIPLKIVIPQRRLHTLVLLPLCRLSSRGVASIRDQYRQSTTTVSICVAIPGDPTQIPPTDPCDHLNRSMGYAR